MTKMLKLHSILTKANFTIEMGYSTLTAITVLLRLCTILLTVPNAPLPISPKSWRSSDVKS